MENARKPYPSDVTDAEWEFLQPFFTFMRDDAPQRKYSKRELFDGMRFVAKTGCQWRSLPNDFPPWPAVYQQMRRWAFSGIFEDIARDLRMMVRILEDRDPQPSAAIMDGRTLQSTPESGGRAAREKGSFYFSWSSLRSEGGLKSQIFRSAGSPGFGSEGCAATYAVTQSRQFLFGHRTIHSGRPVRVAWLP